MMDKPPQAVWEGSFMVLGVEMKCHVLDDGRRIVEAESLEKLFSDAVSFDDQETEELANFAMWLKGK
jgi:hypothetical protein